MNKERLKEQPYYNSDGPAIIYEIGTGQPVIVFNVGTHGNEYQPVVAAEKFHQEFDPANLLRGKIRFVISNPPALRQNKRFLIEDLNRAYPGNILGHGERRIAAKLLGYVRDADYVIDLHTAPNDSPPFVILGRRDKNRLRLAEIAPVSPIVLFEADQSCAMVDFTRCGIGIELGDHNNPISADLGLRVIQQYLSAIGLSKDSSSLTNAHEYYEVFRTLKNDEIQVNVLERLRNFQPIANSELNIEAEEDYSYPILCGVKDYTVVYCYLTKKVSRDKLNGTI